LIQANPTRGLKKAIIIPIFKKGVKHKPKNYHSISLTSIVSKLPESILKDHIIKHLIINDIISSSQHGFVPQRSCLTQQIEVMNNWTNIVNNGGCVDIILLDSVPSKVQKIRNFRRTSENLTKL